MGLEEDNIKYFNDKADWYDEHPRHRKVQQILSEAFEANKSWIGVDWITPEERAAGTREVRLLDYACGTGLVSRRLGPYLTHAVGIDITPSMVQKFNERVAEIGVPLSQVSAMVGNLLKDPIQPAELSEPKYFSFDIAVIGLGFHHFANPADAAKRLAQRLRPGGVLLLIDLLADSDSKHSIAHDDARHAVTTNGFSEEDMREIYQSAGLKDFEMRLVEGKMELERAGNTIYRTMFFAKGVKQEG